jgi:ABC-type bacteriocin/lantibiotic exporter with double-glycine peptidase domain
MGISERMSIFFQSISLVFTALVISFQYSWRLTLVTSSGLLAIVGFYAVTLPKLVKLLKDVEEADRMASSVASETFSSVRMVAACGAEDKMENRHSTWVEESRRRGMLLSPLVALQQAPGK